MNTPQTHSGLLISDDNLSGLVSDTTPLDGSYGADLYDCGCAIESGLLSPIERAVGLSCLDGLVVNEAGWVTYRSLLNDRRE